MVSGSPLSAEKWRADHPVLCGGTQDDGTIVHTLPKHASKHTQDYNYTVSAYMTMLCIML